MSIRNRRILAAGVVAALGAAAFGGPIAAHAGPVASTVAGGITVYQTKLVNQAIALGSPSNPTTVATKAVPPGKYLVTGFIGVSTQPGSYIVCVVTGTLNANDGVFGTFASPGGQVNVSETEVLTIATGHSIILECDDNFGRPGEVVGEAVIEATPVNALH